MPQVWDLTLLSNIVTVTGYGDTASDAVGSVGVPQFWPLTLNTGEVFAAGAGNTNSSSVGVAYGVLIEWFSVIAIAGAGGLGNTVSDAADFAPFTIISPPTPTGFGNTVSSAYGTTLRTFNSIGQDTDGQFDVDQQTTESTLIRPTAAGDFILDGLPLPS